MAAVLKFSDSHLWVRVDGKRAHIGLSDYVQSEVGEIISVELPDVGDAIDKGEAFGELESVKTVSELVAPVTGSVTAINVDLEDHPTIANEDPYHDGWLIEIELTDESEIEELMDADEYEEYVAGEGV